ncbi:pantetheine-phosphate adenylyltransferase [Polymorphobacter sp. PAMC 29334]|uniref:pantetheine-phosphate adenylyltransferase n=1 Tax=Polymorphobacter sp. PAMC 29334 TaxID=2862331 RepID=UPI001C75A7B5|nr:pantetheine-phosphate adenylyltransferase [Polymorphobacter sp. PAMC 29334]QYE34521.1 pantetheine-phosphate adenylyltransferase [Polymorphobacter sp. PAMC 29334]
MRIGVYPGTFDPVTLGHMDIIRRGAKLVDKLIIGVSTNPSKSPMFTLEERVAMVTRETEDLGDAVGVVSFDALLMKFAEAQHAQLIIRGLRAVSDFEYEYQMAGMNQQLNARIETVFLMADVALQPIASKLVKEIAIYDGDIRKFVTPRIAADVVARVAQLGARR